MKKYLDHQSVMANEVLEMLSYRASNDKIYADCTFGAGGHSFLLAEDLGCKKIYCFDQDPEAYANGQKRIEQSEIKDKFVLIPKNFSQFVDEVPSDIIFEGILMDLGVSSHHFDSASRGFSFRFDAPLDMRMNIDDDQQKTAKDIINSYECEDLVDIFQKYGEERFAKRIAEKICEKRDEKPILSTKELEDIVFHCYPKKMRHSGKSPATKIFQALRIEVNDELGVLERTISDLAHKLSLGGRLAIITFHSLEDRIVKNKFKDLEKNSDTPFEILTKRPMIPSEDEIHGNSRARSAKLRVIERRETKKLKNKYPRYKASRQDA